MDSHAKNDETANHNEVCINHCIQPTIQLRYCNQAAPPPGIL